jgi:hypothetical protein
MRLYWNYDPTLEQGPLQMVSSFRALHEMIQVRRGSGFVLHWKQSSSTLLIGGDSVMNVETGCAECRTNVGGILWSYSERFAPKG